MKISIVLGCGFGDEGKGNVTNWLSKNRDEPLVVRFNGGHQAGHTVIHDGNRHVFSSFGSGTLNGTPTFWSKYCTIYPPGFNLEYEALIKLRVEPIIYVDPMCPITTPFDIESGRATERFLRHGSCGSGFGRTVWRHETLDHSHRIFAKDLFNDWILLQKLEMIRNLESSVGRNTDINEFIDQCKIWRNRIYLQSESKTFSQFNDVIFEGSQGILLDREHGIFPHVTRSHTTSKNAIEIIERNFKDFKIDIYYVSRCYQTRHGNGPVFGECSVTDLELINFKDETNKSNEWQGTFRYAPFSLDMFNYAKLSDSCYNSHLKCSKTNVITCLDQFEDYIPAIRKDGATFLSSKNDFLDLGCFPGKTIFSFSPDMSKIEIR